MNCKSIDVKFVGVGVVSWKNMGLLYLVWGLEAGWVGGLQLCWSEVAKLMVFGSEAGKPKI